MRNSLKLKLAKVALPVLAVMAVLAVAVPRLASRRGPRAPGANLIFISIDTLRADHMSCYGYERQTSPVMDAFARENLLFEQHTVTMTYTLPSHTSMFTGLYPKSHGVLKNGVRLPSDLPTLPKILKKHGYSTGGVVSAYPLHSDMRFDKGFDYYADVERLSKAPNLLKRAIPWLDKHGRDRFFLFLHFWDPHGRYNPPEKYRLWGKKGKLNLYDGEILYTDYYIGRLFDYLKREGLYDETVIVITSDHGESLGDHEYWGHGRPLYEDCLRVPLLVHLPRSLGVPPARIAAQTSAVDILPTLLNLLDVEEEIRLEGLDLLRDDIAGREFVFAQRRRYEGQDDEPMREIASAEHFEYGDKYVARGGGMKYFLLTRYEDELYDLEADPGETRNLLLEGTLPESARPERYLALITDWLADVPEGVNQDQSIDEDVRERLKSLGYIN